MYYRQNKARYLEKAKKFALLNPDKVRGYKRKHKTLQRNKLRLLVANLKSSCKYCTETRKQCLEFHHIKKKKMTINRMIQNAYSIIAIKKEIAQCEIICANCHRRVHATGAIYNNCKAKYVKQIKENTPCACGQSFWACLDFHHTNPDDKTLNIGAMIRDTAYSLDDIKTEIEKCIILCVNCHRVEHNP